MYKRTYPFHRRLFPMHPETQIPLNQEKQFKYQIGVILYPGRRGIATRIRNSSHIIEFNLSLSIPFATLPLRADQRLKAIPVIMFSARAGEESRIVGLEAGADDYLVKPFSARELLSRVEAHLKLQRIRLEAERPKE